jgi:hypothetical protein
MRLINYQIPLPEEIYKSITTLVDREQLNNMILDIIKSKIKKENDSFEELLKEGYINSKSEDREIISDFQFSDMENME